MKLLLDEDLSPKLSTRLSEYPDCVHVNDVGLQGATDHSIWDYAEQHGMMIVSKDTDFRERSFVDGAPPKVIWLDVGNSDTASIATLLQGERPRVESFEAQEEASLLILSLGP